MQLQPHLTPGLLDSEAATPLLHPLRVPMRALGKPSNLALDWEFVRQDLFHYGPVFAGTKLTNPILAEMEKRKKPKTLGVTRFLQSVVRTQGPSAFSLDTTEMLQETAVRLFIPGPTERLDII